MKLTLVYDHFVAKGGAENVSLQIAENLPGVKVDVFSPYVDVDIFADEISSGALNRGTLSHYSTPKLIKYFLWDFNVEADSLLLTGLYAPLSLVRRKKNRHSVYFHMYPTFLDWNLSRLLDDYGYIHGALFKVNIAIYQKLLKWSCSKAKHVFCNSKITQAKFRKIGINAEVLYPPVSIKGLDFGSEQDFFLSTCRLEKEKRVELMLEVFAELSHIPLKVVGGGSLYQQLVTKYASAPNISFCGWKSREEINADYQHCKALVYIPENEAFGLSAVEALASGKQVIGVNEGGLREILEMDASSLMLDTPVDKISLKKAVLEVSRHSSNHDQIALRQSTAAQYDEKKFYQALKRKLFETS